MAPVIRQATTVRVFASWVDVRSFGARGGGADDSQAFQAAVDSGASAIFVPEGTWRLREVELRSNLTIVGNGSSTRLLAYRRTQAGDPNDPYSDTVFRGDGLRNVTLRDLTFDGSFTTGSSVTGAHWSDLRSMIDLSNCDDVTVEGVTFTGFKGAVVTGGTPSDDPLLNSKNGVAHFADCRNVRLVNCRLAPPTFTEGVHLLNCVDVQVDNFLVDGGSDVTYRVSTPLHAWGPLTERISVTGGVFTNYSGSVMNLGGKGIFNVIAPTFSGRGIDFGAEHQHMKFADHPVCTGVNIVAPNGGGSDSYLVQFGGHHDGAPYLLRDISLTGGVLRGGLNGVVARQVDGLVVHAVTIHDVAFSSGGAEGIGVLVDRSRAVTIAGSHVFGADSCKTNILVRDTSMAQVTENQCGEAHDHNIFLDTAADDAMTDARVAGNTCRNMDVAPTTPIRLGRGVAYRLASVLHEGNVVNGRRATGADISVNAVIEL